MSDPQDLTAPGAHEGAPDDVAPPEEPDPASVLEEVDDEIPDEDEAGAPAPQPEAPVRDDIDPDADPLSDVIPPEEDEIEPAGGEAGSGSPGPVGEIPAPEPVFEPLEVPRVDEPVDDETFNREMDFFVSQTLSQADQIRHTISSR